MPYFLARTAWGSAPSPQAPQTALNSQSKRAGRAGVAVAEKAMLSCQALMLKKPGICIFNQLCRAPQSEPGLQESHPQERDNARKLWEEIYFRNFSPHAESQEIWII